jgi:glycosyltransferase involved in cell wall biosynthesis
MGARSVIFVAYGFPPHGGPGVQRSAKFVKYLPELGWHPLVITTTPGANPVQDPSLLDDVDPNIIVHRVPGFSIERLRVCATAYHLDRPVVMLNLLLQIPDAMRFWARNARKTVATIIEEQRPRCIYTSSGPFSSHLVGLWAKRHYGIPWFADFRDPWSENLLVPYLPGYRRFNRHLEKRVLASADRVACVSRPWLDDLQRNLGAQPEKFVFLPNGYDDDDIGPLPLPARTDRFTIMHLGSLYRNRRPAKLVEAIRLIIASNRIPASQLRVVFVGKNASGAVPTERPFETQDYVEHRALKQLYADSDVLLLILATSRANSGNYSGKLFEYLACNRPILGIVPPGGVAESLIQHTRTGIAVGGDIDAIANAVSVLYDRWKAGNTDWSPRWNIIRQYTRRNLAARLGSELDRIVSLRDSA